ncbi:Trm112 family protein [Streptomyces sp. M2CJ-2]|uniref:Trm112 family protein n=1 Tax=Streptomyces sp. M2CJ-2 TaxID=2803948 RepID=UPI001928D520|nr:Trm112 family protein [Streptomyces sp. M2CJ-2]MBL3669952.1 Trm112 family protein [Streptomyces sp. M2CJ-2]
MKPDDPLLRILACPLDKGPLHLLTAAATAGDGAGDGGLEEALYNPRLRRRYPVLDGIPQLLPSSGEQVSDEEHERLLARVSEGHMSDRHTSADHAGHPGTPGATP